MATGVETVAALLTVAGIAYMMLALWGARDYVKEIRRVGAEPGLGGTPGVSVLKPLKGVDARMYAGLASHCRQKYAGAFELVFGVHGLDDPAVAEVQRLRGNFRRWRYGWWIVRWRWERAAR